MSQQEYIFVGGRRVWLRDPPLNTMRDFICKNCGGEFRAYRKRMFCKDRCGQLYRKFH